MIGGFRTSYVGVAEAQFESHLLEKLEGPAKGLAEANAKSIDGQ